MSTATEPSSTLRQRDHRIDHAEGPIFARSWRPAGPPSAGAPIVLFHDSLGCVEMWRGFPEALCRATGRTVVAYDRLGFGRSGPRRELPSLQFVAEEAESYVPVLLEQLGLALFVALGHSVGGGMAIQCAAQLPERCAALVTIAAQVYAEDVTLRGIRAAKEQFKDPAQLDRLAKYHGEKTRWVLDAWIENWLSPGFADWTLKPVLPLVTCPTLAIHGELDEYGSPRHADLIGALSSGPSQLELLKGIAHMPHRERPELVVQTVATFLAASA